MIEENLKRPKTAEIHTCVATTNYKNITNPIDELLDE